MRAKGGDQDALQGLMVQYHGPLRSALRDRMDGWLLRHVDPDDILQEAYAAAYRSAAGCRFTSPATFYRWLERIAFNKLKDQQRAYQSQKRDRRARLDTARVARSSYPELIQRLPAPDSTPSRKVAKSEAVGAMISSLARLTDDQRECVRLRFLEELSVAEVAARMGKTEGAVHTLCHRALKSLAELMISITRFMSKL
jgi:RNA polymerase sigma-70 factor (ECF subfamily)